jgi:ParB-like chromosome segregation protein Spo0J
MTSKRVSRYHRQPATRQSERFKPNKLKIEHVPIQILRPNPNNARLHPKAQINKLARAIGELGFLVPVLIDDCNMIIAGHGRIEAAKALGLSELPCIRTSHLSEAQKRAFTIFDNRLAEDSGWDFQLLAKEFEFLQAEGIDLEMTGFEIPEFDVIFAAEVASIARHFARLLQQMERA